MASQSSFKAVGHESDLQLQTQNSEPQTAGLFFSKAPKERLNTFLFDRSIEKRETFILVEKGTHHRHENGVKQEPPKDWDLNSKNLIATLMLRVDPK